METVRVEKETVKVTEVKVIESPSNSDPVSDSDNMVAIIVGCVVAVVVLVLVVLVLTIMYLRRHKDPKVPTAQNVFNIHTSGSGTAHMNVYDNKSQLELVPKTAVISDNPQCSGVTTENDDVIVGSGQHRTLDSTDSGVESGGTTSGNVEMHLKGMTIKASLF